MWIECGVVIVLCRRGGSYTSFRGESYMELYLSHLVPQQPPEPDVCAAI